MSRDIRASISWCFVSAALATGCGSDAPSARPFLRLNVPLERATLKNGLEICVVPDHEAPVVTAVMAVRAGAFLEDASDNGYSHLFEHMIFDGSEDVPDPVEFRDRLDALGATTNGQTNVDYVKYYFTAGSSSLSEATSLFAAALEHPALLEDQLEREKRVVLGEFDLDEAEPDFLRHRRMLQELYGEYVTRVEPLGSRDVVTRTTSDQLHAAHDVYYVPNNALLVLSGDVDSKSARALAESAFGAWERSDGAALRSKPPRPAPLTRSRYVVLDAPISDTRVAIGFMCPGAASDLAGDLLSRVTYRTDHEFRELVGRDTGTSASFSVSTFRYATYATVELVMSHGHERAVLAAAKKTLDDLGRPGNVTDEQLSSAKHELFSSYFYSSVDPSAVAHDIASFWGSSSVEDFVSYQDDVYAVSADALDGFAKSCVRGEPKAVVLQSSADNLAAQSIDAAFLESLL